MKEKKKTWENTGKVLCLMAVFVIAAGVSAGCAADKAEIQPYRVSDAAELGENSASSESLSSGERAAPPESLSGGEEKEHLRDTDIVLTSMTGIGVTSLDYVYGDEWGIGLAAENISQTGLTIVCRQRGKEPSGRLQTGSYYSLERLEEGQWEALDMLPQEGELMWTQEAWLISAETDTRWEVDWEWLYGSLPAGRYRIGKEIMDFREPGDFDEKMYYACFDIVDLSENPTVSYACGGISMSLGYKDGWEYHVIEDGEESHSGFGIAFRPAGGKGWLKICYYTFFGVCGTGLEEREFLLSEEISGSMGIYDNSEIWSFITLNEPYTGYVVLWDGDDDWWAGREEEAMGILETVELTKTR